MTDDIRRLTARIAEEPGSLAFLELAEALRGRGQLDAAQKVARGGLTRYPGLADAHDLMARILSDQGDLAGAFDAWASALQLDPMRTSALKGIAFLYFRAGETTAALEHLERALDVDPDDPSRDRHLMEPEYHGNANSEDGRALAYRAYGIDLDRRLRELGFSVEYTKQDFPENGIRNTELFFCRLGGRA